VDEIELNRRDLDLKWVSRGFLVLFVGVLCGLGIFIVSKWFASVKSMFIY
jgi:hypothetical protein